MKNDSEISRRILKLLLRSSHPLGGIITHREHSLHEGVANMATNLFARVIGTAFGEIINKKGIAKETQRPYDFNVLRVLVADGGISEVVLPDEALVLFGGALPVDGDDVDLLVEVSPRLKGFGTTIMRNYNFDRQAASAA